MKKCPKCKAKIHEDARFCIYCMTPFEKREVIEPFVRKNKRQIILLCIFLIIVLFVCIILFFMLARNTSDGTEETFSEIQSSCDDFGLNSKETSLSESEEENTDESFVSEEFESAPSSNEPSSTENDLESSKEPLSSENDSGSSNEPSSSENDSGSSNEPSSSENDLGSSNEPSSSENDWGSSNEPSSSENDSGSSNEPSSSENDLESSNEPSSSENDSQNPEDDISDVPLSMKFSYDVATTDNVETPEFYHVPDNAIVITKINYVEKSGIYVIPEYIDGKSVVGIMPYAFSDSKICLTVKTISLSQRMRRVHAKAFFGCCNLKDVYVKSGAITIDQGAFPEVDSRNYTITLYCPQDCRTLRFNQYKYVAFKWFGVEYMELSPWTGEYENKTVYQ